MVTVVNSAGEIERILTGKAPERPEVEADNAKQRAAATPEAAKPTDKPAAATKADDKAAPAKVEPTDQDDVEGEDGLTPRQKREFSAQMLKAIGKKHARMLDAEEFAAAQYNQLKLAEERAANLERQLEELRKQPVKEPEVARKPERASFETDEAYQDALVEFRVKEQLAKEKREEAERTAQERQQAIIRAATARLEKAAELVPDFQEVTEAADLRVPGHIAGYMQESDMFAELGYHFAQHPDIMERLAKLSPAKALVEVGKIESTLKPFSETHTGKANGDKPSPSDGAKPSPQTGTTPQSATPSPKSRAPVISPLGSDSASQVEKDPGQMSTREVIEAWKAKNRSNLGLRKRH